MDKQTITKLVSISEGNGQIKLCNELIDFLQAHKRRIADNLSKERGTDVVVEKEQKT